MESETKERTEKEEMNYDKQAIMVGDPMTGKPTEREIRTAMLPKMLREIERDVKHYEQREVHLVETDVKIVFDDSARNGQGEQLKHGVTLLVFYRSK